MDVLRASELLDSFIVVDVVAVASVVDVAFVVVVDVVVAAAPERRLPFQGTLRCI